MLDQYKPGSDLTIMNAYYQYGMKISETERMDDFIAIVYKDNKTGRKGYELISKPDYTFYKAKDNIILDHNLLFIEKDKVEPITVPYTKVTRKIAELTGNLDYFNSNNQSGNRQENQKLHTLFNIFASDMPAEDHYRALFAKKFTNNIEKINKAFFDIEVDTRYMAGDFVAPGECPINAISMYDEQNDIIHTYLLRDKRNPLIEKFENDINSGRFGYKQIKKFITDAIGGEKQMIRFKFTKTKFDIRFYDDEIELLKSFFSQVHTYSPDFIEGWNSSGFDLNYIIERIKALGEEPADIMCDQNWPIRIVKHFIDQKNLSDFAERGDYTFISGTPTWLDQMIQFASRRKSKIGSFKSFKLDDIGKSTAKVKKLDYSHITNNIAMLPWLDFVTFTLYNIFDVIVQKCIEQKTQDLEYIFSKCLVNNTSYKKGHRQTVYLANRMAKEFDNMGYIIGNNVNKWNEKPDKFLGALVGDPLHTNGYAKMVINGVPIFVCESLQDYDYKSLYPSIILEHNIAPNTQIGRIIIDEKVYANENAYMNEKYSRGGEFIENLVTDNIIEFCKRWLHLAGFKEFMEDYYEYCNKFYVRFNSNGLYESYTTIDNKPVINPFTYVDPNKGIRVFTEYDSNKPIKPFFFINKRELEVK